MSVMRPSHTAKVLLLLLLGLSAAAAAAAAGGNEVGRRKRRGGPVFGCRIPRKYIVVQGFGQTNEGSGEDPFETGAHDLAMEDAGIHEFNLVQYTSILPPEAEEVSMDEAKKMPGWHHGAVLECIMSEVQGARGDRITAGVGRMMVHSKSNKGDVMGGFATEYKGHATPDLAEKELKDALEELFERRFSPKDHEMGEKKYDVVSRVVEDAFGVAMAGVCFLDYIFPEVERHAETLAEL